MAFAESEQKAIGTIPNDDATKALRYAIIGIFCFGMILGPMAISSALKAKKNIERDPRFDGAGKATAAFVIGIVSLVLWVLGLIARFATM
jgi:uncharacterized Tic20 family protein